MRKNETYEEVTPESLVDRRYLAKREIARGAMGALFEAQHQLLNREVALKTLHAGGMSAEGGPERLLREARALSLCRHPHIVVALDAGVCLAHGPFIALEMLEGRTLGSLLVARQRLPVPQVLRLAQQLGDALDCVHTHGLIHRDIKPANAILVHDPVGRDDVLKLIDFGIAAVPGHEDVVHKKLTGHGEIVGTPEYMAPELLLDAAPPSVASDLYSFGVLLYECLAGDVPFPGNLAAVTTAHVTQSTPRSLSALRADVPAALDALVRSALERDPARRPTGAASFAKALLATVAEVGPLRLITSDRTAATSSREFARAPYAAPARVVRSGGQTIDGRTEDVSEGGLLVLAAVPLERDERVLIRFPLPSSGRIAAIDGVVRWCKSQRGRHAIGLAFDRPAEAATRDIRTFTEHMGRCEVAS